MDNSLKPTLGIIGGSGLYSMPGLTDVQEQAVETPFGQPSAPVITGSLEGRRVAFLARHGLGHTLNPSEINYRANIYALKQLGVQQVVSISACGSLREDYAPGHVVIPDGLFDFTRRRATSFFENGLVAHVGVADPFCPDLSHQLLEAVQASGGTAHAGGGFITIEGPRFSTKTESNIYRMWNLAIIGMTTSPEAFLAREAELCYAVMAHVTDYDVWHMTEGPVSVERVVEVLKHNTSLAQASVRYLAGHLAPPEGCDCEHALQNAIMTGRQNITPEARKQVALLVDKYLD